MQKIRQAAAEFLAGNQANERFEIVLAPLADERVRRRLRDDHRVGVQNAGRARWRRDQQCVGRRHTRRQRDSRGQA